MRTKAVFLKVRLYRRFIALTDEVIAFQWRMAMPEVMRTKAVFLKSGFIDDSWTVLNWNKRQFISDDVTARVRKYRSKVTPLERYEERFGNVSCNPPEQNRTDTEQKQKKYF